MCQASQLTTFDWFGNIEKPIMRVAVSSSAQNPIPIRARNIRSRGGGVPIVPYRHATLCGRCPHPRLQNGNRECLPGSAECLKALTLVRGGGADNEPSLSTLFLRVFMPKFGRESDAKEGELDLEGGGLMRRLGRFVSRVFGGSSGSPKSADSKGTRRG